jgi:hypothetical protein
MEDKRNKKSKWLLLLIPPVIVLAGWVFGELVMHLWNWLTPTLFGWRQVTFWEALGLLLLCRILFGGFGGHNRDGANRLREKKERLSRWEKMTPEEREKFRQEMRARWCSVGAPDSESKEPA